MNTKKDTRSEDGPPEVGSDIYVRTSLYLGHGEDDVIGGLAQVTKVKWDEVQKAHFVSVLEHPGHAYRWEGYLREEQEKLASVPWDERAHPDPDLRPEFNMWD